MAKVYDEASRVVAERGVVTVDGPDGVAVALTPEAASETSDRLMNAAMEAAGQRREKEQDDAQQARPRRAL